MGAALTALGGGAADDDDGAREGIGTGATPAPLVTLLAGNPATSAAVLGLVDTRDATVLRRLHPAVATTVAAVPWSETGTMSTVVRDAPRWRAAFPAAVGAAVRLSEREKRSWWDWGDHAPRWQPGVSPGSMTPFAGLTELTVVCLAGQVPSLRTLAAVGDAAILGLPPTLVRLTLPYAGLTPAARFGHLAALQVLECSDTLFGDSCLASLPPSLRVLVANNCRGIGRSATFQHLPVLQELQICGACVGDAAWMTMPPSVTHLNIAETMVSLHVTFERLPGLRVLDCSHTAARDAAVASLPPSLTHLNISGCTAITRAVRFDHLPALAVLTAAELALSPDALAACRLRGCCVPYETCISWVDEHITAMAPLPTGHLAVGSRNGAVRLWDPATHSFVDAQAAHVSSWVAQIVALPDTGSGGIIAVSILSDVVGAHYITTWDMAATPPAHISRVPVSDAGGVITAVTLPSGPAIAANDGYGGVRVWFASRGEMMGREPDIMFQVVHAEILHEMFMAALPDGHLATACADTLQLWDVGHRTCVATLRDPRLRGVRSLVVRPADGAVALGRDDGSVDLWQPAAGAITSLASRQRTGSAAVALVFRPDGRLANLCRNNPAVATLAVWGVRHDIPTATWSVARGYGDRLLQVLPPRDDGAVRLAIHAKEGRVHIWRAPPPSM